MNPMAIGRERPARPAVAAEERPTANELYERHLDTVYGYVSRRTPTRQEAEDITAEVFAAAIDALPRFTGRSTALAWLIGIARRKLADWERRRKRSGHSVRLEMAQNLPAGSEHEPGPALAQAEAQKIIQDLVSGLPANQREALMLQYADSLPIADIAAVMGRSQASVNSLLQRARQAIYRKGHSYFLPDDEVTK